MAFSDYYNATFDSVGFMEEYSGRFSAPRPSKELEYTARKVPGGDITVVESTGKVKKEFTIPIACLEAQLDLLESKVSSKKTLVRTIGTFNNIVLLKVTDQKEFSNGGEDIWRANLTFIET